MAAWLFWLILFIVFCIVEAATVSLVSVWFAAGSLLAFFLSFIVDSFWIQVAAMLSLSAVTLGLVMAFRKRIPFYKRSAEATNVDRLIGCEATVVLEIDPDQNQGQVRAGGQIWTAAGLHGEHIPLHSKVRVEKIEGVKLMVSLRETET